MADAIAFTRGGEGAPDTRGLSLVERHAEARARAAEEATLARLHAVFGSRGVPMSVLALAASASSSAPDAAPAAEALVREFLQDKGKELDALMRRRSSLSSASTSSSSSDDDSGSSSDDDDDRRQHRHRQRSSESKKKKSKDSKRHSKEDKKHKKHRHKEEKKKKKRSRSRRRSRSSSSGGDDGGGSDTDDDKKKKTKKKQKKPTATTTATTTAALTSQYGLHGLLRAENPHDADRKRSEFCSWCLEVQKVSNLEALARWEETELWKTFVEDFNTATLPSEKYYDLDAWSRKKIAEAEAERKKKKKKGKKGDDDDDGDEGDKAAFNAADDEAARRREERQRRADEAAERLKEAYNALKYSDAGKKEDMKRQEMLKIELRVAARTGDAEKVARLQKLLAPDPK